MLQVTRSGREICQELIALERQIDQLQVSAASLAAELAASRVWDDDGFNGPIDWIRFNCHLTSTVAADRLNVGEHLANMPESIQAMREGEIGYAHLKVMARTADWAGGDFDEEKLLPIARESSPGKFHYKCLHFRHSVDAQGFDEDRARLRAGRALRLNTAEDGCLLISGSLDPVGGAAVRTALEALARPSGVRDDRNREQRMADALVELAAHGGNMKVQMQVTSSIETLLGLFGAPGAEAEFSLPISSKTVQRWACDCSATRILMQDSVVIDVGRAERTIKGPKRRALNARDQHCQWPECERPASWCDGHHYVHWLDGGGGELDNLVLLCARHHFKVHEGGWQLVKTDGEIWPVAPLQYFAVPRGPD